MKDFRPRLRGNKLKAFENITKKEQRVLVIGDLHEPFSLDEYLNHCAEVYAKYNCNRVVFIGDVIDSHYSSYHESDPDGMGAGEELEFAIERLSRWYKMFPKADVLIGNHDRIISRKAFSAGVPKAWIKSFNEVLNVPKWNFTDRVVIDNVQYIHGEAGTARTKAKADMMNTVQGHLHTQCYTEFFVGANFKVFGTQVGCGIDFDKYAFAYAKRGKKPAIGCAVVMGGKTVVNELMEL
jgi:metallophosphoesterase superfamily enzyme